MPKNMISLTTTKKVVGDVTRSVPAVEIVDAESGHIQATVEAEEAIDLLLNDGWMLIQDAPLFERGVVWVANGDMRTGEGCAAMGEVKTLSGLFEARDLEDRYARAEGFSGNQFRITHFKRIVEPKTPAPAPKDSAMIDLITVAAVRHLHKEGVHINDVTKLVKDIVKAMAKPTDAIWEAGQKAMAKTGNSGIVMNEMVNAILDGK